MMKVTKGRKVMHVKMNSSCVVLNKFFIGLEKQLKIQYHLHDLILNLEFPQHVYYVHSAMLVHVT